MNPLILLFLTSFVFGEKIECEGCKFVIGKIEEFVDSGKTIAEIEKYVDKICTVFHKYNDTCEKILNIGVEEIITLLVKFETPDKVCEQIGLCKKQITNTVECEGCKFIVNKIEQWIESGKTIEEIEKYVDKICFLFPKYNDTCAKFIDVGIKEIVELLIEFEDPETICKQIGICDKLSEVSIKCILCVEITGFIDQLVTENRTADYIKGSLESYCLFTPLRYDNCKEIVDKYVDKIIDSIKKKLDPTVVCKSIGLCEELNNMQYFVLSS